MLSTGLVTLIVAAGLAGAQSGGGASAVESLFQARCAGCHDPNVDRAPSRAQFAQMAPEQIVGALNGIMAPMADGLSADQKQSLANYLGAKPASAPSSAPASTTAPSTSSSPKATPVAVAPAKAANWSSYLGDMGSTHYSPLEQVNAQTISGLHVAWRQSSTPDVVKAMFKTPPTPSGNNETTPLMIGGLIYFSTGVGGVAALDPETGKVVWHVDSPISEASGKKAAEIGDLEVGPAGGAKRSVAYWADGKDGRIIALLGNKTLTALNAKTGKRIEDFGQGGEVNLSFGNWTGDKDFAWRTGPTVIVRGVIIVGSNVTDINNARMVSTKTMPRGDVRGYDARTGKLLWTWHAIPQQGEFGNDTWLNDSWKYTGNVNVWGAMSGDEALGYVYLPETTPSNDWYGGARPGAGLFGESIVALDARTGKRVWHFQGVHHGLWDYDFPCAPTLVDIVVKGKRIHALAQPSKQAYLYVLDRATGKPIWPIVEKPVPAGDAPGEWYSPTQPMPLDADGKPFAYDQQGATDADLIDFTPELHQQAVKLLDQYVHGPIFTPPAVANQGVAAGKKGSLHMPGTYGGTNWPGAGFDPETGILYVPSAHTPVVTRLVPPPPGSDTKLVRERYEWPAGPEGLPLFKPPYGRLVAVDLNAGRIKWTVANGDGPRNNPALKGLNLPPLGQPGRVGPLVTKSLVFMGDGMTQDPSGSGGKKFRAFDKATGKVVWETTLDGETTGVPMTYSWKGKQYIIVPIGGAGHPGEFVALSL